MAEYLARHIAKINRRVTCQELELEPGHIAYIQYTNRRDETKYGMYVILDVNPKASQTVHGLDMNKLTAENFYRLFDFAVAGRAVTVNFKNVDIRKIIWKRQPVQNYQTNIKPRLANDFPGAYKMLKFGGIKRIQVIDYKYDDKMFIKYVRD